LSNNDAPSGSGNHNSHNTNAPAGVAEPVDVAAAVLKAPSSGARAKPRKPLNAASSGSSDSSLSMKSSSPAPMPPPSLMRSQQGGSDENVLLPEPSSLAAAPASSTQQAPAAAEPASGGGGKHGALARRTSAVLLERLNHDDEYRSATTSDTTGGGGTVAGGTDAALLGASSASLDEDGSVVVSSNGSYVLTRTKSRDSASPLPNSGDTMPLDDDARLWFGDRSRMERIISFQRSSSGRHGISQTTSGLLIRHPIVLTGPSPSKDDDSSAGTLTADAKHSSSARTSGSKHGSARAVLSFGSSPSSSDVESRRRSSGHTKRRHHRTRRGTQPPTIQPSSSVQDVLSAVGVTGAVPESLIFTVLSPTHIASLDRGAIADALSTDDGSSSTESSSSSTSLGSSSSSATPRSTHTSPMRLQVTPSPGPHVEQSPKRRVSPLSPPISPAPRTPSPQSTPSSKTSPTHDLTHVTVDDRRERIVSMKTSKSGRHTITHTETGKVITQPVFFSPGGVVMTESVPIYEAEEATTIASVAARTSAHRLRGRNNSPAATTNNLSTSPIAANTTTATAAATAATTTTTTTTTAAAAATTASTMGTTSTQQQATTD
jgi:hypothetical protein